MAGESQQKYFCPRLIDYVVIVGARYPNRNNNVAQTPEMLRRYPMEDHSDFPLPPDVVFFCQPEGCISVGPKRMTLRESTSFVFTLTEKDTGRMRYGICVNFYRPFERKSHDRKSHQFERHKPERQSCISSSSGEQSRPADDAAAPHTPRSKRKQKSANRVRNHTLTSLCIISHHPFFSTFREGLFVLRKLIDACNERSCSRRIGGSRASSRDSVWGVLTGHGASENTPSLVMHEVREIETWILRLLSAPVPVPGKTRVEVNVLPRDLHPPLIFALPDHTRFSLVDFPLHLPLELLGVDTCLKVLEMIILEYKIVIQSRDYNALSMSVLAFVCMLYPLEYMFPVIPLLPTCMSAAEHLLLAPTPYIIGLPTSFLMYKTNFSLPNDVWLVDLDSNKVTPPREGEDLPPFPEPEGALLKNHLKQALASMSMSPQPIKNLDQIMAQNPDMWKRRDSFSSEQGFNPLIYGNDVDSVDVATRVAMVRFFNSPNTLANFAEHTRTLRLYPRPVVAFQLNSFIKSRPSKSTFTAQLAKTQAVEYFAEYALSPTNVVFLRVQTGVYDPLLIGDKPKWYCQGLQKIAFHVYDEDSSSLGAAISAALEQRNSDEYPTDESGSDSDGADSTSSSYSSLSDFVMDMQNSDIGGDATALEEQCLTVDESRVYQPPCALQVPDGPVSNSDSALSAPDSDEGSSSEEEYRKEIVEDSGNVPPRSRLGQGGGMQKLSPRPGPLAQQGDGGAVRPDHSPTIRPDHSPTLRSDHSPRMQQGEHVFRYDSGKVTPTRKDEQVFRYGSPEGSTNVSPNMREEGVFRYDGAHRTPTKKDDHVFRYDSGRITPTKGSPRGTPETKRRQLPPRPPMSPSYKSIDSAYASMEKKDSAAPIRRVMSEKVKGLPRTQSGSGGGGPQSPKTPPQRPPPPKQASIQRAGSQLSGNNSRAGSDSDSSSVITKVTKEVDVSLEKASEKLEKAGSTISELFAGSTNPRSGGGGGGGGTSMAKASKPFAPLGNRKALVEKSGLVKHAAAQKKSREKQQSLQDRTNTHSDNQAYLKDVVNNVLEGQGVGWLKTSRVKKLMEDENYRNFVVSRLNTTLDRKLTDEDVHLDDVCVSKQVFKGMLSMVKTLIAGLEVTYQNHGVGGMASAFNVLEIIHTHYWEKDAGSSSKSDSSNPSLSRRSSPFGSRESLSSMTTTESRGERPHDEQLVPSMDNDPRLSVTSPKASRHSPDVNRNTVPDGRPDGRSEGTAGYGGGGDGGDMLRELVKNKEMMLRSGQRTLNKYNSVDSDVSDGSTLLSVKKRAVRALSVMGVKSHLSAGFRYHDGKLMNLQPSPDPNRTYLFEHLIGKDRSWLWDQMQFWEDAFLDAVAQERDIIGMDQGPTEMMERYVSLGDSERKRLEYDEDRLLSVMLYNMVAFMVTVRVSKSEMRRKVRRLLGKCHVGLICSQDINNLLDQINNLHGNDIDLKPVNSRMMQKQSFTVHWGPDNTGDMLFMEVCDDCLILRSVTGAICDRWWYEKLVNMTYCPKTKVLCLWRKQDGKTQLNKFYTKKCKELYFCVKDAMEKAAARNNGKIPGPELGGEFPVQDLKSGNGGLLQVCMEGIGLLFANSKLFIELSHIKKCFTQKGGIFVLEEFDPKTRKVTQRKYKSSMANEMVLLFHRVVTVQMSLLQKAADDALANQMPANQMSANENKEPTDLVPPFKRNVLHYDSCASDDESLRSDESTGKRIAVPHGKKQVLNKDSCVVQNKDSCAVQNKDKCEVQVTQTADCVVIDLSSETAIKSNGKASQNENESKANSTLSTVRDESEKAGDRKKNGQTSPNEQGRNGDGLDLIVDQARESRDYSEVLGTKPTPSRLKSRQKKTADVPSDVPRLIPVAESSTFSRQNCPDGEILANGEAQGGQLQANGVKKRITVIEQNLRRDRGRSEHLPATMAPSVVSSEH